MSYPARSGSRRRLRTRPYYRRLTIATALWAAAVALMTLATLPVGHDTALGQWSLLMALCALLSSCDCLVHYTVNRLTQNFALWAGEQAPSHRMLR